MQTYELTYIISSQINSAEADSVKNEAESVIQSKEGVILKSEKMGAQPLSYPVKKQGSGYFNVTVFQVEENHLKEIKSNLDKNSKILRSVIVVKKPVKQMKERRTRKPLGMTEFEIKRKPSIMEKIMGNSSKNQEKVDTADLDKKLDELLNK